MASPDTVPLFSEPHRRWNPLRGDWVLVSPGRTRRPWQGVEERPAVVDRPSYDPECYLCPGNVRANGGANPSYERTFVFTNDFAALRPETSAAGWESGDGLLRAEGEPGTCRVVCFSPRHDLDLGVMAPLDIRGVVDVWAAETQKLGEAWRWVQVFENRGEAMGASNPHPHGQIWAGSALPVEAAREDQAQRDHLARSGRPLLLEVAELEADGPRVVESSDHWLAIVPFWALWPFETLLIPRAPAARLPDLDDARRDDLAAVVGRLLSRYDGLFGVPFPYSMGWHGAPFEAGAATDGWQLHAHVYPPLLRSASVRKFMVGYELLAEAQRDVLPEEAAERLREVMGEDRGPP
jgi:UDPglucose--hexose-1-phosphate uridylyltransferase